MKELFLLGLQRSDLDILKVITAFIAISVRNRMEDFHVNHLTDRQMKELNPIIREGIFESLLLIAGMDKHADIKNMVSLLVKSVPPYWEEPIGDKNILKYFNGTLSVNHPKFKSKFLNEQMNIGNLIMNKNTGCVEIITSSKFRNIEISPKRHRDKTGRLLRKEGYVYSAALFGYFMPLFKY